MASQEKIKTSKKTPGKQLRKTIREKLVAALADHKNGIDEKDFQQSLKKASKIISKDLANAAAKKMKQQKKKVKKKGKEKEFLM